ncbi:MAG TPA: HU family DNA-binding protein [Rickettsia endosymbiont of Omalisus fontisbellaquei]|nr:HU family DNA-binding protein [Rickettsia endosymbiont of Omalisus fontisbellaquei]
MNKAQFIEHMSMEHSITKTEAEKITNLFTKSITTALAKGEEVTLTGFGNFYVSNVEERTGRNPKTNQPMIIPAYKQPKFSTGKSLKDACNENK